MAIKVTKREAREFAKMVRGEDTGTKSFQRYLLHELRCARRRAQMLVAEIETIGIALKSDFIDSETAMQWLSAANALEFLQSTEPPMERIEWPDKNGAGDAVAPTADVQS